MKNAYFIKAAISVLVLFNFIYFPLPRFFPLLPIPEFIRKADLRKILKLMMSYF